jgi:hypothetical protein
LLCLKHTPHHWHTNVLTTLTKNATILGKRTSIKGLVNPVHSNCFFTVQLWMKIEGCQEHTLAVKSLCRVKHVGRDFDPTLTNGRDIPETANLSIPYIVIIVIFLSYS